MEGLYKTHFDGPEIFYTGYPFELRVDLDELVRRPRGR
jgi:hypothetical protein